MCRATYSETLLGFDQEDYLCKALRFMEHVIVQCSHSPARVRCQVQVGDKYDRYVNLEPNEHIYLLQSLNVGERSLTLVCVLQSAQKKKSDTAHLLHSLQKSAVPARASQLSLSKDLRC